ncbi:helix-turn-helix domain-containing protein [Streptomyces sp. NPDC001774]
MRRKRKSEYFGMWLDRTLANRGITSREAARAVGTTEPSMSRWRSGEVQPLPESCSKLALYLDVDEARLLTTAGHLAETPDRTKFPLPPEAAKRRQVRERLLSIPGVTKQDLREALEHWDDLKMERNVPAAASG